MDRTALAKRWRRLFNPEAADVADTVFTDIARRYDEPGRYYHTLNHISTVLDTIALLDDNPSLALHMAAWLHDVVYDTRANDNEERSADYVFTLPADLAVPHEAREEAARLIRLTKRHVAGADDWAGQVLLDADLAILATGPAEYAAYAAAIRREYDWVDEPAFRTGRHAVLEQFLARPWIFGTAWMRQQAEGALAQTWRVRSRD